MNIWDIDKALLFIAFVIPGFISIKSYELFFPAGIRDSSKLIVDAITYSCINYAIMLLPIYIVETGSLYSAHPFLYVIFYVFILLINPVILTYAWKSLRECRRFQKNIPHPTEKAWDYVFSKGECYWIIVTLKNGEKIAGKYDEKSFSSSSPSAEQIYLEECWALNKDDGFDRARNGTKGVLILSSEIVSLELFEN